jgi:large subunit ribosomal protein L1
MAEKVEKVTKKTTAVAKKKTVKKAEPKVEAAVVSEVVLEEPQKEAKPVAEKVAKAGKRSEKALKEAEEKVAKEERKAEEPTAAKAKETPKKAIPKTRTRVERKGKKYREAFKQVDKSKVYSLTEAIDLGIKTGKTKFDSTLELHIRLGVDPRQADQNIRDNIMLPSGTGKVIKIAVYAEGADLDSAKKAGADVVGEDEFLQQLEKAVINFDVLITKPQLMQKLSKYARLLGPKGLMPNPKNGTVTNNIDKAVKEARLGKIEYKIDSSGIIHCPIGKVSFGPEKILANAQVVLASVKANKPQSLKGNYVRSIFLSTTMGPSIQVEPVL